MRVRLLCFAAACLILSAACSLASDILEIDTFSYATPEEAGSAWEPKEKAPAVVVEKKQEGLVFPCPFKERMDRVYWDRRVSLDLSPQSSFEFEFTCDDPKAIRSMFVYMKSGDGYYAWGGPLKGAGRQTLVMLKDEFTIEGNPEGWDRIDRVRISPWRGTTQNTRVLAHSLRARSDSILLIQGTVSAGDEAERKAAKRATRRISRWLKALDIPHGILSDENVTAAALSRARAVVLCYNPKLPDQERKALASFVRGGGKLMVFYSADPGLAKIMHMKLGDYKASERPGQWSYFTFTEPETRHTPKTVFQESWNIRPVYPADTSARAIAFWHDAAGKQSEDPAWVASKQGLWMSHILLNDDAQGKQGMLLGMLATFDPSVWPKAADNAIRESARIDSFKDLEHASDGIARLAKKSKQRDEIIGLLEQAQELNTTMTNRYEAEDYPGVIDAGRELRGILVKAYALSQPGREKEFRGVWDHDATGWYPGDWDRTCSELASRGITAIFPNMAWAGVAHFDSKILPHSKTFEQYGDQLAQCVEAAHRHGLEVHVWKICWNLENAPQDYAARAAREGRLQKAADGSKKLWLCPSDIRNRALELAVLKEIARRYEVDGIHLDYVRYPDANTCYALPSQRAFEKSLGKKIKNWPQDVRGRGKYARKFQDWRTDEMTSFVKAARSEVKAINPSIKLSAAVFANYPACGHSVAQDWGTWLKQGIVDFVCPMSYVADASRFGSMTRGHMRAYGGKTSVYPGIGVTSAESQLTPDQVIEQIAVVRTLGAPGFMLFKLDPTLRDRTLPILSLGPLRGE